MPRTLGESPGALLGLVNNLKDLDSAAANEFSRRLRFGLTKDYRTEDPERVYASTDGIHEMEPTSAIVLPQVLTAGEVSTLLGEADGGAAVSSADVNATAYPHDLERSTSHVLRYLHKGGQLQTRHPQLAAKLVSIMTSAAPAELLAKCGGGEPLRVRCIELHTYTAGGGLLNPGHRDCGSILTMSVLLSDPARAVGGEFLTWREHGTVPVVHAPLRTGDAVLFHSEKLHNVSTLRCGLRRTLVVELWASSTTNVRDRHS